jgi:hypothetical protein
MARGDTSGAIDIFLDAITRSTRLPDGYLWAKAYALDALCGLAIAEKLPEATVWIGELQNTAARSGMRALTLSALKHRASMGDIASAQAAQVLMDEIDSPPLNAKVPAAVHK